MKKRTVKELIQLAEMYKKLYDNGDTGLTGVDSMYSIYNRKPTVHLRTEKVAELFGKDVKVRERGDDEYPYEVSGEVDDVIFFCICDEHELKEHFPNNEVEEEEEYDV